MLVLDFSRGAQVWEWDSDGRGTQVFSTLLEFDVLKIKSSISRFHHLSMIILNTCAITFSQINLNLLMMLVSSKELEIVVNQKWDVSNSIIELGKRFQYHSDKRL